jgi:hypothetical protein
VQPVACAGSRGTREGSGSVTCVFGGSYTTKTQEPLRCSRSVQTNGSVCPYRNAVKNCQRYKAVVDGSRACSVRHRMMPEWARGFSLVARLIRRLKWPIGPC